MSLLSAAISVPATVAVRCPFAVDRQRQRIRAAQAVVTVALVGLLLDPTCALDMQFIGARRRAGPITTDLNVIDTGCRHRVMADRRVVARAAVVVRSNPAAAAVAKPEIRVHVTRRRIDAHGDDIAFLEFEPPPVRIGPVVAAGRRILPTLRTTDRQAAADRIFGQRHDRRGQ
jgi:hypothetical protein